MSGLNISFRIEAVDNFSKVMNNLDKQSKKAFDTVGQIGAGLTAAGAASAIGLGAAVKVTADFEKGMSRVAALSGATDGELAQLTQTAKDLGAKTAFSASQASDGMSFLAMAGYKTNDIIAAMPGLLDAAAAGQTDLARTADITSNILGGFGLQASETGRVADVLTKTFTSANVDMEMLGTTMSYLAPVAKSSGQSLEMMAAATGILGNAGIQGSKAGTSLAMSLTRLASPSKEAAELMSEIGFKAFDAQGNMLPLNKILENLQSSTKGLTQEQRMHAISTIFGAESMKSMLTLVEAGPAQLAKFTGELKNAGGTAGTIATKQLDNLSGQLTILKSGLEAMAISIGTALLPAVKWMASGMQSLVDLFNGLNPATQTTIAIVLALITLFALLVGPLLILVAMIPSLTAGFTAIAGALGLTAGALAATLGWIALVIVAIVAIGAALVLAYNKVGWFRDMVDAAWATIKETTVAVFNAVKTFIMKIWSDIKAFWDENGKQIMAITKAVFSVIAGNIRMQLTIIQSVISIAWNVIKGVTQAAWNMIKGVISNGLSAIMNIVRAVLAILRGDWKGALGYLVDAAKDWMGVLKSIFKGMYDIGKNIILGLINGIKGAAGRLMNTAKSIANKVKGAFKGVFDIHSPSREMEWMGDMLGAGLIKGMTGAIPKIQSATAKFSAAAMPNVGGRHTNQPTQTTHSQTINNTGLFEGAVIHIREEADIKKFAREFAAYQKLTERSGGVTG